MGAVGGVILIIIGTVFLGVLIMMIGMQLDIEIIENIGLIILYGVFGLIVLSVIGAGVMCLRGK